MDNIGAKEKFSFNLLHPEHRAFDITILYMVYKTVERNTSITINQLKWVLENEYLIRENIIDGALSSLTSKSLFACISRWSPPTNANATHLRTKKSADFDKWLAQSLKDYPELSIFTPPEFRAQSKKQ